MSAALSPELVALILFGSLLVMFLMKVPIAFSLILSSVLVLEPVSYTHLTLPTN